MLLVKLQIFIQAHQTPPKVTVAELLQQLTVTQAELENIKVRRAHFVISHFWKLCVDKRNKYDKTSLESIKILFCIPRAIYNFNIFNEIDYSTIFNISNNCWYNKFFSNEFINIVINELSRYQTALRRLHMIIFTFSFDICISVFPRLIISICFFFFLYIRQNYRKSRESLTVFLTINYELRFSHDWLC